MANEQTTERPLWARIILGPGRDPIKPLALVTCYEATLFLTFVWLTAAPSDYAPGGSITLGAAVGLFALVSAGIRFAPESSADDGQETESQHDR